MPWSYPDNVPDVAQNWTADEQRRCVEAANAVLEETGDDEQAIYACIAAAGKELDIVNRKQFRAPISLKSDGDEGTFEAVFATFNVIDRDGDVTKPGAFRDGQKVRISAWGHNWGDLPVGKGVIHADDEKAWVEGRFFLDTGPGADTYRTVKGLEELQEWSYGFDILKSAEGEFEGERVRYLEALDVYEVSPVMLGAGIGTRTTGIKGAAGGGDREDADAGDDADGSEGEAGDGNPSGGEAELVRIGFDLDLMAVDE